MDKIVALGRDRDHGGGKSPSASIMCADLQRISIADLEHVGAVLGQASTFIRGISDAIADAVVVLQSPKLEGNQITYQVDVLEAELPAESGPCALFIDPLGLPLSPMSVAGVDRRARRRASRLRVSHQIPV